ncbi:DUF7541 family protein [Halorarum salinum]|uniref:Cox cluster protein n=1 Tax=Halorarum salinum TaxID=2743089 RepID=A0A7D5Q830_9EURY|nr:cox cluster protein [Halobaculum salinum]QLG60536.1 cox cluster protein [Halobaculum salinum]
MDENPGLSDQYRMASPWPLFVALGLPIAELGLLFGIIPLAVGGVLLFGGSIAGMVTESGYASTAWRALAVVALFAMALGAALVYADPATEVALAPRGYATVGAGLLMLLAGVAGELFDYESEIAA